MDPATSATGVVWKTLNFDVRARSITVAGHRTMLNRRTSAILALLIENYGDPVEKDVLLHGAWPDQFVHENSLAKAISELRRAIRGSGLEIAASYGLGYILRPDSAAPAVTDSPPAISLRFKRLRRPALAVGGLAMLALIGIGANVAQLAPRNLDYSIRSTRPILHDAPDATANILWVDDHPVNNRAEVATFRARRIAVHVAESTDDALKLMAMNRYQLVISDLGRGEDRLAGIKMIAAMRQRRLNIPVLIYTVRPADPVGSRFQRTLVVQGGAADLAVTPQEVRAKVLSRLIPPAT